MKGNDWVPFHKRLAKGPKKAIRRGVRFVLLELSLEARATGGVLDLPPDWTTLDAVHDLLGGDRKEIRVALEIFQIPDSTGEQVLQIERDESRHRLKINKWEEWAGPKSSATRVAEHRERKKVEALDQSVTLQGQHAGNGCNALEYKTGQDRTVEKSASVTSSSSSQAPILDGLKEIEAEIRRHAIFDPLDAHALAVHHAGRMVGTKQRVAWVLRSIEACAGDHVGLGLNAQALTGRLSTYIRGAREPREGDKPVRKVVEASLARPTDEEIAARTKAADERRAEQEAARKRREAIGQSLGGGAKS